MSFIELLTQMPALFTALALLVGLMVGSFLNVVIYRVPVMLDREWREQCAEYAGETIEADRKPFNLIRPGSSCPACKASIRAWQNIPIVSYLMLRGRCAACGASISIRYPIVEGLTALASAAVAWKFGFGAAAIAGLVLTWFLIALTFIDVDHQLLPDVLTLPLLWLGMTLSVLGGSFGLQATGAFAIPVDLRSSVIGAMAGYLSLWSIYHLFRLATGKEGMGYGDFKLLAALGAWMGWKMLVPIVLISAAVGAVIGMTMLAVQRRHRSTPIPFGPFLAIAGWLMLLFGPELVGGYLGVFGPRL